VADEEKAAAAAPPPATALEAGIADLARQALAADPEAAEQMKRYQAAVIRLEKAKAAEKELESIMQDAMKAAVAEDAAAAAAAKARADQLLADAEVAAAERLMTAAELELGTALDEQRRISTAVNRDGDRAESGKAAAVAAAGGAFAALPLLLAVDHPGFTNVVSFAASIAACLLFGITYRYAVRTDETDTQLKAGVVAAFGLVRAIGAADIFLATEESGRLTLEVFGLSALYAAQSMLVVGFAAVAMELAFSKGFVQRVQR